MKKGNSEFRKKATEYVYSTLSLALTVFAVVIVVFTFVFRVVGVSGDSMNPTLLSGSRILVFGFMYEPERGDVIAFGKIDSDESSVIKRVVGMPGDIIDLNVDSGIITVNGEVLSDGFEPIREKGDFSYPLTVPEGCVFVLGDNRNNSLDSRFSEIGFVRFDEILGKAMFGIFPPGKIS